MNKLIHFKEDTSKPENRVNLTLFHLLMIDEIKEYINTRLGLTANSVIYPAPNLETEEFHTLERPDFKVVDNRNLIGYVEVELGKDIGQVELYKSKSKNGIKVYSIFGKKSDNGDLSLEEIYEKVIGVQKEASPNNQRYWSLELLSRLIKYYIIDGNFNSNNKRVAISDKMKTSKIIVQLFQYFGEERIKDGGKIERGKLLLDTVGENGFSLKVFSRHSSNNSLSLMNRTGGRETIYFPSYVKLQKYSDNKNFVENYSNLLISLGCSDIKYLEETQKAGLSIKIVENNMKEICSVIYQFF